MKTGERGIVRKVTLMVGSETGWDPGPLLQCCGACIWAHLYSSNKIRGKHAGLKLPVCMHSWDKLWAKDPTATFGEPGAKAGYCAYPLHTPPPKGWAIHLSHPSGPGHTPTLTPYKEQAHLPLRECGGAREPVCSCSLKPCLNFLSGL